MERKRLVTILVAGFVGVGALGWIAGRQIKSPAQVAADTAAPSPSLITAPVEKRALAADVIVRGTVRHTAPVTVALPVSAIKSAASGGGSGAGGIVTTPPLKGTTIDEGKAVLAVAGRPVFVLQGALPAYRDLGLGVSGPDVRQLQEALTRLRFKPGPVNGVFSAATGAAVAAWYRAAGWDPFAPTEQQRQLLRSARDAAASATDKRLQAQLALDAQAKGLAPADLFAAQSDIASAQDGVAAAIAAVAIAQAKVVAAQAALARAITPAELAQAQLDLDTARAELVRANAGLDSARAKLVFAQTRLDQMNRPPDLAVLQQILAAANVDAARAATDLARVESQISFQVPADELLFFPSLPLRVDDVKVKRGDVLPADFMTVSGLQLAVDAALSVTDAKLVTKGATAVIEEPDLRITASGTVTNIADRPGTNGVDPQKVYLEVTPTNAPPQLVGASVKITIPVKSTGGAVLVVPVSAVTVGADGTSRVQVVKGSHTRFVGVNPGLVAQGLVEVTPTTGKLAVGDQVVVGRATVRPAPAAPSTPSQGGSTTSTSTTPGGAATPSTTNKTAPGSSPSTTATSNAR